MTFNLHMTNTTVSIGTGDFVHLVDSQNASSVTNAVTINNLADWSAGLAELLPRLEPSPHLTAVAKAIEATPQAERIDLADPAQRGWFADTVMTLGEAAKKGAEYAEALAPFVTLLGALASHLS